MHGLTPTIRAVPPIACEVQGMGIALAATVRMTPLHSLLAATVLFATLTFAVDSGAGDSTAPAPRLSEGATPFDRQAAVAALSSIDLAKCKSTNAPHGEGHIAMKFAPAGTALTASVDRGPLVGTPVAKCIAKEFKKAKVPAFSGDAVQVGKSFRFE
jgi:hypothetical protein